MGWEHILELLRNGENESVEFHKKLENSTQLAKDIVALSNAKGGYIVLGIDDKNGHFIGETVSKEWILAVGKSKCSPAILPNIEVIDRGGRNIILITVYEGNDKPYTTDNLTYIRENKTTRVANKEEEKSLPASKPAAIPLGLNERQKKAVEYIRDNGFITNMIYRDLFKISHKTAHIELTNLVQQALLVIKGQGRSTRYIIPLR